MGNTLDFILGRVPPPSIDHTNPWVWNDGGELDMNDENVAKFHDDLKEAVSKGLTKQMLIDGMK